MMIKRGFWLLISIGGMVLIGITLFLPVDVGSVQMFASGSVLFFVGLTQHDRTSLQQQINALKQELAQNKVR